MGSTFCLKKKKSVIIVFLFWEGSCFQNLVFSNFDTSEMYKALCIYSACLLGILNLHMFFIKSVILSHNLFKGFFLGGGPFLCSLPFLGLHIHATLGDIKYYFQFLNFSHICFLQWKIITLSWNILCSSLLSISSKFIWDMLFLCFKMRILTPFIVFLC